MKNTSDIFKRVGIAQAVLLLIMLVGFIAFEIFNYSTTEFAFKDIFGDLNFAGLGWATILSIAFCGIDFAGIARIFTPEQGRDEPAEVWYLFGAWILAAAMNASLTWWGITVAIAGHKSQGAIVIGGEGVKTVIPIFVAVMVWVIRLLLVGTFTATADRILHSANTTVKTAVQRPVSAPQPQYGSRPNQTAYPPQVLSGMNGIDREAFAARQRAGETHNQTPSFQKVNTPVRPERLDPTYRSQISDRTDK